MRDAAQGTDGQPDDPAQLRSRRQERRQHQERHRRQRWIRRASAAALSLAALGLIAVLAWRWFASTANARPLPSPGNLPGLQATQAPWPPEYGHLVERYNALQFPPNGNESYHIHALLHVYVDGRSIPVPANIGISAADQLESPLHTHDASGVIHIEAAHEFPFRLADVFAIWGVVFTDTQLGGYTNAGDQTVQVFVTGQPIADPVHYVLKPRDNIVVAYGTSGSFPTQPPADALNGL